MVLSLVLMILQRGVWEKDVVVCSASILQECLSAGLTDEIYLDVAPLLLGKGVRLFDHLDIDPVTLERIYAIEAPSVPTWNSVL